MVLYSYFFVNCSQSLYLDLYEVSADDANDYSDSLLKIIGRILESKPQISNSYLFRLLQKHRKTVQKDYQHAYRDHVPAYSDQEEF